MNSIACYCLGQLQFKTYWTLKKTVTEYIQRGMETRYPEDPVTNGAEIAQSSQCREHSLRDLRII